MTIVVLYTQKPRRSIPRDYALPHMALKVDNPCPNIYDNDKITTALNSPTSVDGNEHGNN